MAWRDKLQKGSFRGAPFFWQKSDGDIGRKTARHDYPLRDETYVEDLGKAPREFTLEVLVIGPNYMADRDRLIAALETAGPGTLVHPTFGAMRVALNGKPRVSESTSEGGMARFTLPFVQAADNKQPAITVDTAGAVATKAATAKAAVKTSFGNAMSVAKRPAFVAAAAQKLIGKALDGIKNVRRLVSPPLVPTAVTDLVSSLDNVRTGIANLVYTPFELADEIQGLIAKAALLTENPLAAIAAYGELFDFGDDFAPVPTITASRVSQANNQSAIISLVKTTAVIEAASASAQADFDSYQQAQETRTLLVDRLDAIMETADDALYTALLDLRTAVIVDINSRGANLSRIVPYTPQRTLPALVVAYQVYSDASESDNLVARNRIRHPGFVPGGVALEVLTNG